jgi:hypothetical protein
VKAHQARQYPAKSSKSLGATPDGVTERPLGEGEVGGGVGLIFRPPPPPALFDLPPPPPEAEVGEVDERPALLDCGWGETTYGAEGRS